MYYIQILLLIYLTKRFESENKPNQQNFRQFQGILSICGKGTIKCKIVKR